MGKLFWLKKPTTILRRVDVVLVSVRIHFTIVYLGDTFVLWKSATGQVEQACRELQLLYDVEVTRSLRYCNLFAEISVIQSRITPPDCLKFIEHGKDAVATL